MTSIKSILYKFFGLSGNFENKIQAFNVWLHLIVWLLWNVMIIFGMVIYRAYNMFFIGLISSLFFVLLARFLYKVRGIR